MTEGEIRATIKSVTGLPVSVRRPRLAAPWGEYTQDHGWAVFSGATGYIDLGWEYDRWGRAIAKRFPSRREAMARMLDLLGGDGELQLALPMGDR